MYSLIVLTGEKDLIKVEKTNNPDSLELCFDLGMWGFPDFYKFFTAITGKPIKDSHVFSVEEKEQIQKELKKIIKNNNVQDKPFFKESGWIEKVKKCIKLNNPKDYRIKDSDLNPFSSYSKELYELNHSNPLQLNHIKWYKKLLKIFKQETVVILSK